ncbi:MAG: beta-N-acetylhexosaminidase [Rhodospirillum sp.]|nr:beta-N-acetylhexosaminidase [Rhodospirillum sp.]MCF8490314.1 beta-N-acetylhexosaminidase [Rhodospirillum sp.]MCF8500154.1 beta-N-acetylhexosaminidase [Rhodospirillum sp.]
MSVKSPLAVILGVSGTELTPSEAAFLREADPFGFILFARNIDTPVQVRALTESLRATVGRSDAPILIDQEGGRVQRLRPPHWPNRPPANVFGALYAKDVPRARAAATLHARLIAHDLRQLGIDTNCLPVMDVRQQGAHDIIGDRAFSEDPSIVGDLGQAVVAGLLRGGVYPVIKHIPGHGRSHADSHEDLPVVDTDLETLSRHDIPPFRAVADAPFAMTAHIVYSAIDPTQPATVSAKVIGEAIRGACGFQGLLMTDDLSMKALDGPMEERTRRSLAAGCDLVLHCNGDMVEMEGVIRAARPLDLEGIQRWHRAKGQLYAPDPAYDPRADEETLAEYLS